MVLAHDASNNPFVVWAAVRTVIGGNICAIVCPEGSPILDPNVATNKSAIIRATDMSMIPENHRANHFVNLCAIV